MTTAKRKSVFILTDTEKEILRLVRQGYTYKNIQKQLGWKETSKSGSFQMISEAIEKERLQKIMEKDTYASEYHTRLNVARGAKRMKRV